MRGRGMRRFARNWGSVSQRRSKSRLKQLQNVPCNSRLSTGTADALECGAFLTGYYSRFRSIGS